MGHDARREPRACRAETVSRCRNAPSANADSRRHAGHRRERYTAIRSQWATVDAEQEARCTEFREQKSLIQRDVVRTDRRTVYFGSADHGAEHLRTLEDVLLTYVQWNQDLGYMQGMNDIAAVFLETLGDAADTFWCFAGWMEALVCAAPLLTRHPCSKRTSRQASGPSSRRCTCLA